MEIGQIISLLSGAGIGAILSAFLVFINNSKKNKLDFVTRERSEWRREIKSIIVDLLSGNNRSNALSRLETLLNPYGRYISKEDAYEFYMNDGHIWEIVDNFDYSTKSINVLTKYLELLLKYDWERSKREIKLDIFNSFIYFILIITSLSNSLLILFKITDLTQGIVLTLSSFFMIASVFYFRSFTKNFKKRPIFEGIYIGFLCLSMYYGIDGMLYWLIFPETKDLRSLFVTLSILALILSTELKIIINTNIEEKKYILCLKEILIKEHTHV